MKKLKLFLYLSILAIIATFISYNNQQDDLYDNEQIFKSKIVNLMDQHTTEQIPVCIKNLKVMYDQYNASIPKEFWVEIEKLCMSEKDIIIQKINKIANDSIKEIGFSDLDTVSYQYGLIAGKALVPIIDDMIKTSLREQGYLK